MKSNGRFGVDVFKITGFGAVAVASATGARTSVVRSAIVGGTTNANASSVVVVTEIAGVTVSAVAVAPPMGAITRISTPGGKPAAVATAAGAFLAGTGAEATA